MAKDTDADFWRDLIPQRHYCWARQDQHYADYGLKDWWSRYIRAEDFQVCVAFQAVCGAVFYGTAARQYYGYAQPVRLRLPTNDNFCLPNAPARRRPYPLPLSLPGLEKS